MDDVASYISAGPSCRLYCNLLLFNILFRLTWMEEKSPRVLPYYWPFVWKITCRRSFLFTKAGNAKKCFHVVTSSYFSVNCCQVFMVVSGDWEETGVRYLQDEKRRPFKLGSTDYFLMATPRYSIEPCDTPHKLINDIYGYLSSLARNGRCYQGCN